MSEMIRASAWLGLPELLAELGADPSAVLAEAGLSLATIARTDEYLPVRAFADTVKAANRATGRTDIGMLTSKRSADKTLGVLGIAARNARTIREAIEIGSRYIHIHRPGGAMTLAPVPGTRHEFLEIEIADLDDPDMLQISERILAMTYKVNDFFSSGLFKPLDFHLTHERISPIQQYVDVFGMAPRFNQPAVGMLLESAQLDQELPNRSAELSDMAILHLQTVAERRGGTFADKALVVTRILVDLGQCRPEELAAALGVKERTLQRRLNDEGLSFETLRDEARRRMAEVLLRQGKQSLTEIALMLGYSDSSSLSRSCKRWFGVSPREMRAGQAR